MIWQTHMEKHYDSAKIFRSVVKISEMNIAIR